MSKVNLNISNLIILTSSIILLLTVNPVSSLYQKMIYIKRDTTSLPYPSNQVIHQLSWIFTDSNTESDILDDQEHEFQVNKSDNSFDFAALKPRYGDITRLRHKESIINFDGSHVGGEHYGAWNVQRMCNNRAGLRPYVSAYVKFFSCAENAKEFYKLLNNYNKIRYDADNSKFDELDRAVTNPSDFNLNTIEDAFTSTLDICAFSP
jgi:hypothetical protein